MKTVKDLQIELSKLTPGLGNKPEREKLMFLIRYLETNPKEQVIQKQLNQVQQKITVLEERFNGWRQNNLAVKNPYATYQNLFGINKLRTQKETLTYLLS